MRGDNIPPCPKCGAGYPTVQTFEDEDGKRVVVCTHCRIMANLIEPSDQAGEKGR